MTVIPNQDTATLYMSDTVVDQLQKHGIGRMLAIGRLADVVMRLVHVVHGTVLEIGALGRHHHALGAT